MTDREVPLSEFLSNEDYLSVFQALYEYLDLAKQEARLPTFQDTVELLIGVCEQLDVKVQEKETGRVSFKIGKSRRLVYKPQRGLSLSRPVKGG
jgi:hypothetical protein